MFDEKSCRECAFHLSPTLRKKLDALYKDRLIFAIITTILFAILLVYSIIADIDCSGRQQNFYFILLGLTFLNGFIFHALEFKISLLRKKAANIWKDYIFLIEESGSSDPLSKINSTYFSGASREILRNFNS